MVRRRKGRRIATLAFVCVTLGASTFGSTAVAGAKGVGKPHVSRTLGDIAKIDHVVVLMQENRSFDDYFSRLHFQGQPQLSVESQKPNPNPLGGPPIHTFLTTTPCTTA